MSITEAQARRALRHADIPCDREVEDPREDAWVFSARPHLWRGTTLPAGGAELRGRAGRRSQRVKRIKETAAYFRNRL